MASTRRRGSLRTWVEFGDEWDRVLQATRAQRLSIPRRADEVSYNLAKKAAGKAAAMALRIPSKRKHGTRGTRKLISRGVKADRRPGGAAITTNMPRGMEALPGGFTSQWRHPVFGMRSVWVTQHSHFDWFEGPIQREFDDFVRNLEGVIQKANETIAAAGFGR